MELKTCPFCGHEVEMIWWDGEFCEYKGWEPCDEDEGVVFPFIHCVECSSTFHFSTPRS